VTAPSGANNCVMPTFLPMIPLIILVIDSLNHLVIDPFASFNEPMNQ
jgi:hypothetical protein